MNRDPAPFLVPAGGGEILDLSAHRLFLKVAPSHSQEGVALAELEAEFGGGERISAQGEDTMFYILDGQFRFEWGTSPAEARPGDCVFVPAQTPYAWRCTSATGGLMLVMRTQKISI